MHHAELFRYLAQVRRSALEALRGCSRNYFQIGNLGQTSENLVLHSFGEISVVRVASKTVERQNSDAFFRDRRTGMGWLDRGVFLARKFAVQLIGALLVDCALNGMS